MFFGLFGNAESRSLENPQVSLADPSAWATIFGDNIGFTSEVVNRDTALSVPVVWACIDKIAGSISSLPLHVYKDTAQGRVKADGDPVYALLHDAVNDDYLTSVQWRRELVMDLLLEGRSLWFVERNKANRPMNLWPLDVRRTKVEFVSGRRIYRFEKSPGVWVTYQPSEVLDFVWMPGTKPGSHINPLDKHRDAIGLAIAATRFAATQYDNGGVPTHVAIMPASSAATMNRAADDLTASLRRVRSDKRPIAPIPAGVEIKAIGTDPDKLSMVETRKFQIVEICRIWNVPPALVKDLSGATFSNTEQQNLAYVQHTLTPLLELIEQELTAKMFGRRSTSYVEFNLDALLRGDSAARGEFYDRMIKASVMTPDEVRAKENLPARGGNADKLIVQGAMITLDSLGEEPDPATTQDTTQNQDPVQPGTEDQ